MKVIENGRPVFIYRKVPKVTIGRSLLSDLAAIPIATFGGALLSGGRRYFRMLKMRI